MKERRKKTEDIRGVNGMSAERKIDRYYSRIKKIKKYNVILKYNLQNEILYIELDIHSIQYVCVSVSVGE